jgi:anti-sigma factor RsiW
MNDDFQRDNHNAAGGPEGGKHEGGEHELAAQAARLTAYALGELDETNRAAVEQELTDSEGARQELARIRRSVEMVTAALATEPAGDVCRLSLRERTPFRG